MNPLCLLLGGLFRLPNCQLPQPGPQILTTLGPIEGSAFPGSDGSPIRAFRGIPYGRVEARGQPSVPVAPWSAVRSAVRPAPPCPAGSNTAMREDCLVLNVFLPAGRTNATTLLPTLVVLLSEELVPSSPSSPSPSSFLASSLVPKGLALVTIQYRTGVFGFLHSESPNTGLFDVYNGLRFILDNSETFGIDKFRISIGGVGEGAQIASIISLSPATKGNIAGLILLSGSSWSLGGLPDPYDTFFSRLDCFNMTDSECFRRQSLENVEEAADSLLFHATIGDMLVPNEPSILLDSRHKIPTMITLSDLPDLEVTKEEFERFITEISKRFNNQKAEEKIRNFYYPLEEDLIEEQFSDLKSDVSYRIPALREAVSRSAYAPVWVTKLDDYNELMLLLEAGENPQKRFLVDSMAEFIKTGNPSTSRALWPKFGENGEYLYVGNTTFIDKDLLKEELKFWKELSLEMKRDFFTGELISDPDSASAFSFLTVFLVIFLFQ